MPSDLAACCKVVAKRRASAKPCTVDGLVPLRICRSSAVRAAVVVPWKVMTTRPDRSRNADAFTLLAVVILKNWPDRLRISVRPRADALDRSSEARAAFSNVCRSGAGANRTGKSCSKRSGPINEVWLSPALLLIALPQQRFGERSYGREEFSAAPRRGAWRFIAAWRRRGGIPGRPGRAGMRHGGPLCQNSHERSSGLAPRQAACPARMPTRCRGITGS